PDYYPFLLRLSRHQFIGLGKFMARPIHQMRTQKSLLAAHPSCSGGPAPMRVCPQCGEEEETFTYAILRCLVRLPQRLRLLKGFCLVSLILSSWLGHRPNLLRF